MTITKKRLGKAAGKVARAAGVADRVGARRASKSIGFEVHLPVDIDMAAARVTDALRGEGFGLLTRIDVQATLREKLGVEFRPYLILGACNPALAHRALAADTESGLLLPCNVTLEEVAEGNTVVRIADPAIMLQAGALKHNETIRLVAKEAASRLRRVEERLSNR